MLLTPRGVTYAPGAIPQSGFESLASADEQTSSDSVPFSWGRHVETFEVPQVWSGHSRLKGLLVIAILVHRSIASEMGNTQFAHFIGWVLEEGGGEDENVLIVKAEIDG